MVHGTWYGGWYSSGESVWDGLNESQYEGKAYRFQIHGQGAREPFFRGREGRYGRPAWKGLVGGRATGEGHRRGRRDF